MKPTRMSLLCFAIGSLMIVVFASPASAVGEGTCVIRNTAIVQPGGLVMTFAPQPCQDDANGQVTFVNGDNFPHRIHGADDGVGFHPTITTDCFNTGIIPGNGGRGTVTIAAACQGTAFTFHCEIHPDMRGTMQA